jgi:hypothetical protein
MFLMRFSRPFVVVVACLAGSCASATPGDKPAPQPAHEIVSGGARVRGGGVRMDVQIGRPLANRPARSTTVVAKPAAVVTP